MTKLNVEKITVSADMVDEVITDFESMGVWSNDHDVEKVRIGEKVYALDGWDGECWRDSWECFGDYLDELAPQELLEQEEAIQDAMDALEDVNQDNSNLANAYSLLRDELGRVRKKIKDYQNTLYRIKPVHECVDDDFTCLEDCTNYEIVGYIVD